MTDAQRVAVQKWVSTSSHGGMVAVVTNAPERTYVKWTDYAALEANLAEQAAEIETRREDYATLSAMWKADEAKYRARAEAAERAREEASKLLRDGEACVRFFADARRKTGHSATADYFSALADRIAAFLAANGGAAP